jgi:hypothetical protein
MSFAAQTMRLTEKFINPLEKESPPPPLEGAVEDGLDDLRRAAIAAYTLSSAHWTLSSIP